MIVRGAAIRGLSAAVTPVRIGEIAVARDPGAALVILGLSSCVGVTLIAPTSGILGLAHVMLSESPPGASREDTRYADTALPALHRSLMAAGARGKDIVAVLVGGAELFQATGLRVGPRNVAAVQDALSVAGIPVRAGGCTRPAV